MPLIKLRQTIKIKKIVIKTHSFYKLCSLTTDTMGCLENAIILMIFIFIFGIPTFFIVGGIYTGRDGIRGLIYANTTCRVHSTSEYSDTCKTRLSKYTSREYRCYGAIWAVYHGENKTIAATIKDPEKHSSRSDAIKKANQYRVSTANRTENYLTRETMTRTRLLDTFSSNLYEEIYMIFVIQISR